MTIEEQAQRAEAEALLTLEITSENVKTLVDALQLLAEADMAASSTDGARSMGFAMGWRKP